MNESRFRSPLLVWTLWAFISLVLGTGPANISPRLESAVQSVVGFSLNLVRFRSTTVANSPDSTSSDPEITNKLLAQNRALSLMVAELHEEVEQLKRSAPIIQSQSEEPLLSIDAAEARVIGQRGERLSDNLELLISLGKDQKIQTGELILAGDGVLIDQGEQQRLTPDQLVTVGRALFGRTTQVGKQTALIQPITSADFKVAVRIVRHSALGPVQGPKGILSGTGNSCKINEVLATEAVKEGDEVYTDRSVSPGSFPIYCGRIVNAVVAPTANTWTIDVQPLHTPDKVPATVSVLRTQLNPVRIELLPAE
ncbi:rod shape-determining protein MreC [Planctomicrobium sp. SH668]|uniref:rod shape-determining protein MreC n=1 Tax=Planctomicrobium sp. SH668 TaxID=3448126 RepID=UPI003F5C46B1